MTYVILENGHVSNLIEASEEVAEKLGAVEYYDGLQIGDEYWPINENDRLRADVDFIAAMLGVNL